MEDGAGNGGEEGAANGHSQVPVRRQRGDYGVIVNTDSEIGVSRFSVPDTASADIHV